MMAKTSNFVTYPNAVPASLPLINDDVKGDPRPVPAGGAAQQAVRGDALRPEGAAGRDPAVDQDRHRQLSLRTGA